MKLAQEAGASHLKQNYELTFTANVAMNAAPMSIP